MEHTNIRLTASEISSLWTQYMFDSMSVCFVKYALTHLEDKETIAIYEQSLALAENHIQKVALFFKGEDYSIPDGFTDRDVNLNAPRLFQDPFYLYYMYIMSIQGLTGYALSLSTSVRADMRKYFSDCNTETMTLFEKIMDTMLSKGIYTRPPVISPPEKVEFVTHQNFMAGWLGQRRPLTTMEISDITFNI